jgi:menaquinone-dependent protoporphyrinogen oxidase
MNCLVTAATRHGSTMEIATIIAGILRDNGVEVVVAEPEDVASLDGYDGVVLGSAIYMGRWLEPARQLVDRCGEEFRGRHVWLFSSGPLGEPAKPDGEPIDAKRMRTATGAMDHRVFPGRLLKSQLGFGEKVVATGVRAAEATSVRGTILWPSPTASRTGSGPSSSPGPWTWSPPARSRPDGQSDAWPFIRATYAAACARRSRLSLARIELT